MLGFRDRSGPFRWVLEMNLGHLGVTLTRPRGDLGALGMHLGALGVDLGRLGMDLAALRVDLGAV